MIAKYVIVGLLCPLSFAALAMQHPADVAVALVEELYIRPLEIKDPVVSFEVEPYRLECAPDTFQVRVFERSGPRLLERLKVTLGVEAGRVNFLVASGELLDRAAPAGNVERTITYFERANGWKLVDAAKSRGREGFIEARMFDPSPPPQLSETRRVVFRERAGLPVLVGSPGKPANYCAPIPRK